jgi:hypothetical protein
MLGRRTYLSICMVLLMILSVVAGYQLGYNAKHSPTYVYLNYDTVSNSKSVRKLLILSGISVDDNQWKCFIENIKRR